MIKQLAVAGQNPNNVFKAQTSELGCCEGSLQTCEYTATVATASAAFTALTFKDRKGNNKTVTFSSASGVANIKAAILAVIDGEGYEESRMEGEPAGVVVATSGSNTIITLTGELEFVSITNGSGAQSFTKRCTAIRVCTFFAEWAGSASGSFTFNGTVTSSLNLPFSGTAADVDTALTPLVTSPVGTGIDLVTVVKNTTTSKFEITITTDYNAEMLIGTTAFTRGNCVTDYKA